VVTRRASVSGLQSRRLIAYRIGGIKMIVLTCTAEEAARSWQDAIAYYEQSVNQEGFAPHRPMLDFVRRIAASAYPSEVRTWIGMGVLNFEPRSHCEEPRGTTSASVTPTNHGMLHFEIRHYPSGRILLRRECDPTEAERVFASVLLRLTFDR
jgi:hypothetical protein